MTTSNTTPEKLIVYKGFNADWTCRDYQFELGKTFTHTGDVGGCSSGFHACENPLDILRHYPPTGQMAICELSGDISKKSDGDSKVAGRDILIIDNLTIPMLVSLSIKYITKLCKPEDQNHATGDYSASSATGDQVVAAAYGHLSKVKSSTTGVLIAAWYDGQRKRVAVGYVGEDGIEADTWYHAVEGKLVKVEV